MAYPPSAVTAAEGMETSVARLAGAAPLQYERNVGYFVRSLESRTTSEQAMDRVTADKSGRSSRWRMMLMA